MKFTPDYILDIRRLAYKREYDEVFSQIHDAMDCPELLNKLQNKERKLQARTKAFLKTHNHYFSAKRRYLMDKIFELVGAYDDKEAK